MDLRSIHTRLLVRDYAACFRFYRDVLGLAPGFGDEQSGYADFALGETTLALFARQEMADAVGTGALLPVAARQDDVALIAAVADVDQAAEALRAKGVALVTEPHDQPDWGIRVAHFRDPDGTLIEINQPLSRAPTVGEH